VSQLCDQSCSQVFDESRNRVDDLMSRDDAGMHFMHMLEALLRVRQVMIHPQLYLNGMARKHGVRGNYEVVADRD